MSKRKYEGDGHTEVIDPDRLTLGNVVRMVRDEGALPAFSDTVITGIYVQFGTKRRAKEKSDKVHFTTLGAALRDATSEDYVLVKVARPYLYADNPFGSMPNWLMGMEPYELDGHRIRDSHKVVVMSRGEYDCYLAKPTLHKWEVIVGNIGKVYDDLNEAAARESFKVYARMSKEGEGRAAGESVVLMKDGEIVEEVHGKGDV